VRVFSFLLVMLMLGGCGPTVGNTVGKLLPQLIGGMPDSVPPHPGTREYDEWFEKRRQEQERDKSTDPKPNEVQSPGSVGRKRAHAM
jgi:hypothetical protein